jgi:hypothetical protein
MKLEREQKILKINCDKPLCKLEILVEAFGHVNFGV